MFVPPPSPPYLLPRKQLLVPVVVPWQGQLPTREQEEQATLSTKEQGVMGVVAWSPSKVVGREGGLEDWTPAKGRL